MSGAAPGAWYEQEATTKETRAPGFAPGVGIAALHASRGRLIVVYLLVIGLLLFFGGAPGGASSGGVQKELVAMRKPSSAWQGTPGVDSGNPHGRAASSSSRRSLLEKTFVAKVWSSATSMALPSSLAAWQEQLGRAARQVGLQVWEEHTEKVEASSDLGGPRLDHVEEEGKSERRLEADSADSTESENSSPSSEEPVSFLETESSTSAKRKVRNFRLTLEEPEGKEGAATTEPNPDFDWNGLQKDLTSVEAIGVEILRIFGSRLMGGEDYRTKELLGGKAQKPGHLPFVQWVKMYMVLGILGYLVASFLASQLYLRLSCQKQKGPLKNPLEDKNPETDLKASWGGSGAEVDATVAASLERVLSRGPNKGFPATESGSWLGPAFSLRGNETPRRKSCEEPETLCGEVFEAKDLNSI